MADESQLEIILKQGADVENEWRRRDIPVDLSGANLRVSGGPSARACPAVAWACWNGVPAVCYV